MKIRALVVTDKLEDRKRKDGSAYQQRNLSVVDQEEEPENRLEQMVIVTLADDEKHTQNLFGKVVDIAFSRMGENWMGLNGKGRVLAVDGAKGDKPAKV